jgi:6-pyruvoyltetrahydropterin/6-carboxytetrahydropterin synthase
MRITKLFDFSSGHRLSNYDGPCYRLHGHNYHLEVTIEGKKLNGLGMVMDFGDLKEIVKNSVDVKFDHKMILKMDDPINMAIGNALTIKNSICWVGYNPTAENMAQDIFDTLTELLGTKNITVAKIRLYETPTSYAEIEK